MLRKPLGGRARARENCLSDSRHHEDRLMHAVNLADLSFDAMNEADVRAEVIDPVLHALGYRSGTEHNILRERALELRYLHIFLGRKKPGKDPVLRGKPDYICEVRGFARWPVEAKPPSEDI